MPSKIMKKSTIDKFVQIRKHLHAHPEVSGDEGQTAAFVYEILQSYKPTKILKNLGGTGILAVFEGKTKGKTLLFRAELDALPIQEINDFSHKSTRPRVSHKCGHDGHSTVLLALGQQLAETPLDSGQVLLLFQPAEETGEGAKCVLEDPKWAGFQPDFVFAFHNLPGYPLNTVVLRQGSFSASVKSMILRLEGKTSHAAEPEHGFNPALAIAEIIQYCAALSNNDPERANFAVITPVHIQMGEVAYGISAGAGEVHLTIRTWSEAVMDNLKANLLHGVAQTAKKHQLQLHTEWLQEFAANQNDAKAVDFIETIAKKAGFDIKNRMFPFKWGEDFGLFTQRYKGAMFGIGSGENCPALHNPDYDFPDEIIPVGAAIFYGLVREILDAES